MLALLVVVRRLLLMEEIQQQRCKEPSCPSVHPFFFNISTSDGCVIIGHCRRRK